MIVEYAGHTPQLGREVFLAPGTVLIGRVFLGDHCSVWFGAVLRADNDDLVIGDRSNIQEGCILHVDDGVPLRVGQDCVVGHAAVLHGCTLGDRVLIGIGARVLNRAVVEDDVIVAAGSLVPEGVRLESGHLYMGVPARKARPLREDERERIRHGAEHYVEKGRTYRSLFQGD